MRLISFWVDHRAELAALLQQHVWLVALSTLAAVVIGVQFWYADQGGVYVLWYLPLLLLMMFRPNLVEVRPPDLAGPGPWVFARIRRAAARWWVRDVQPGPTRA